MLGKDNPFIFIQVVARCNLRKKCYIRKCILLYSSIFYLLSVLSFYLGYCQMLQDKIELCWVQIILFFYLSRLLLDVIGEDRVMLGTDCLFIYLSMLFLDVIVEDIVMLGKYYSFYLFYLFIQVIARCYRRGQSNVGKRLSFYLFNQVIARCYSRGYSNVG